MPLTPGMRLGSFEIAALIGVGGMGEVYRATDTNLKRAVAIKVCPPQCRLIQIGWRGSNVKPNCSPR